MKQRHISFLLSQKEAELLEEVCYLEPWIQDNLRRVKQENGQFRIKFERTDLAECLGAVAYQTNLTKQKDQMQDLHDKLKTYLILSRIDIRPCARNYRKEAA